MLVRLALAIAITCGAGAAAAQQLYRWIDQQGRTHVTDTPPPPGAKDVRRLKPGAGTPEGQQVPFVLQNAMNNNPVTLYSAPDCGDPCASARDLLNRRGVPFKEVQVLEEQSIEELKRLSGGRGLVPALKVGAAVESGFERSAYEALLDAAGYPKAGILPPRAQAAPAKPEALKPEPAAKPEASEAPEAPGPYAPGAPRQGSRQPKK
jgi:glutaredoxin